MNENGGDTRFVRLTYGSLGTVSTVTLLVLVFLLLLGACSRPNNEQGHPHPPGTLPHTDAPPGSAGEILEKKLVDQLPPQTPGGHDGSEGLTLGSSQGEETVYPAAFCDSTAKVRQYNIVATNVEITLNRFLDYDPDGRMYVLESDLPRIRQEEAQNLSARVDQSEPAGSLGLQGDGIQPLVLRVNQGECLRVRLKNSLDNGEPASFHLHGSGLHLADIGTPAIATNSAATVSPGESVTYEWMVEPDELEGTHYFHSHGDSRNQTNHGLFGALVVEPQGSVYLDPLSGRELSSGWAATIQNPVASDFREFAIIYHEVGNERYRHLDKNGQPVPLVDEFTSAYKPGSRAINYRSEPFRNRLSIQQQTVGIADSSQAYSSYTFGDPSTPIARTYLGDPVKQRVVHGGSEVFHVHHVHGGAIRWRRQPGTEPTAFDTGLNKHPELLPKASERVDSQSIGPSESYDLENECGSGGCQGSVGDYLIHCHVAHHYIAGMWMMWRVYNTLQDGSISQDDLAPLLELPDRKDALKPAITSQEMVGQTVDWKGQKVTISNQNLADWVEPQLPPRGVAKGYDASVLDWRQENRLYLNEPESVLDWPGFRSSYPGTRPPILFSSQTGRLAYPFLRPHPGQRPPFAPNHGPAPFLSPFQPGRDPPLPGENGPGSLCPSGTNLKEFVIHAINLPITLNRKSNLVDPVGQLYVLKEDEDRVRANDDLKTPLAIRANAGNDCIDIIFKSELEDSGENNFFSKANIHIHFVQFDIQGSDGVNTGFNYETSIRPFTREGEALQEDAAQGSSSVLLEDVRRFQPGILVGVGMDQEKTFEMKRVKAVDGNSLVFDEPLRHSHFPGEIVSTEFVRYRWYPDVQFGTAYFHDHVSALTSWKHGLFGALIAEPPGSTYHDPHSGAEVKSGPLADIRTNSRVSTDVIGSFRELVLFIQDNNPLSKFGDSSGSSFNLRVEPLGARDADPARRFSSIDHGDPETPILEAFLGDPMVVRGLVGAANDVHTLHVDGHWFRTEPYSDTSPPVNTVHIGISERYDLVLPRAGGPQGLPGDYLYYNGRSFKLKEGSWGIVRVHSGTELTTLQKLPGHQAIPPPNSSVCPAGAPLKEFFIAAVEAQLPMLGGVSGKIFVTEEDRPAILSGVAIPEPLVLRVNVGDCMKLRLKNETQSGEVSLHADMLAYDPRDSSGVAAGFNPSQGVVPGESQTYTYFAHPEVGETVALLRDWGNVTDNPGLGLYGAIIVGPTSAVYSDPVTGEDISLKSRWKADVRPKEGHGYRDFVLFIQDEDEVIGTAIMPYSEKVKGVVGLNYRKEPLKQRLEEVGDTSNVYSSDVFGDPATPLMEAFAGDQVRIHVTVPFSEQAHVFTVEGHRWPLEPGRAGSDLLDSVLVGGLEALSLQLVDGAGGRNALPGDYLYGDHREPYREAGIWGLFRVYPVDANEVGLRPLAAP